jgi:hypothetical protein
MTFTPPHRLVETHWVEFLEDGGQQVQWSFEEGLLRRTMPDASEHVGVWSVSGDHITIRFQEGSRIALYTGKYADDLVAPRKSLSLHAVMGEGTPPAAEKRLWYAGQAYYPETGQFSREWYYYWNRFVPQRGQADTLQGEILRITSRLSGMYGNSGGGNWMEAPGTYDAFAEVTVSILCDGTLDKATTDFVQTTVSDLKRFCRGEEETCVRPDESDVDRLADLALEWCKKHAEPIPRQHDPRMAF